MDLDAHPPHQAISAHTCAHTLSTEIAVRRVLWLWGLLPCCVQVASWQHFPL